MNELDLKFINKNIFFCILGGLARIWAVTLVNPLELVRTKMQSQKMAFYQVVVKFVVCRFFNLQISYTGSWEKK